MSYWKYLPLAAIGILASSVLMLSHKQTAHPLSISSNLILPNHGSADHHEAKSANALSTLNPRKLDDEQKIEAIHHTLSALKRVEAQAIKQTEALISQPWDDTTFDQEWSSIESLWIEGANELVRFLPANARAENSSTDEVGVLITTRLLPLYREFVNRQQLTAAMHAHHKSIFLAEQPDEGSLAQCDVDASFADSPEKWEEIVTLRKKSVEYLEGVSQNVSFYDDQVLAVQADYQEKLQLASQFYRHSSWYFAIQKAVCATTWGEKATQSRRSEDWAQSAALWEIAIERLENAPTSIPFEIPTQVRDKYQAAESNLDLWNTNLKNAELKASDRR